MSMFTPAAFAKPFNMDSADFDGTNDFTGRGADLTGNGDSKLGVFSGWLRLDGGDGSALRIITHATVTNAGIRVSRATFSGQANRLGVTAFNAAGTTILQLRSSVAYTASATWLHLLMSWDMASASHLYVSDVDRKDSVTFTDDTIDYTQSDYGIGGATDGSDKFNGALAELYFAPGQYLDFSTEANRRKFITAGGKPVYLGPTGALPTGTAPLVYFHLDKNEAVANFATNRGTGGNFSITGTLETGSTSPSD